jgi:fructose-specific phosphotransferase system IIC component
MARRRVHLRLVVLGGAVTSALTALLALTYAVGTGGLSGVPVLALVLGPVVGVVAALSAPCLSGHPAGKARRATPTSLNRRPPALPVRSVR